MTTATTTPTIRKAAPMRDIYSRLKTLGIQKKWLVSHVLPEWWDDELARTPASRSEIEIYLARNLGLELAALRDPNAPLHFAAAPRARFKRHNNASDERMKLVRAIGSRLGNLAASAYRQTQSTTATNRRNLSTLSSQDIRQAILSKDEDWVGLDNLLEFCFAHGVAVAHATLPDGYKNLCDGMALCPHGRPVILSFNGHRSPAWQAFVVAHELGHHVLGHIGVGGEILDEKLDRNDTDEEESAANRFAFEVLTGASEDGMRFIYNVQWPKAEKLANEVEEFGRSHKVHPGVILLNLCHNDDKMRPLAMKALKEFEKADRDAFEMFSEASLRLDRSEWSDDEAEFFLRLVTFPNAALAN